MLLEKAGRIKRHRICQPKKENPESRIPRDYGIRHSMKAIAEEEFVLELKQNKNGFTLIELIVVIAILGVLAAVLVPSYIAYIEKSRAASDRYALGVLNESTRVYYAGEPAPNPFEVVGTTDAVLMQTLVGAGFFSETPAPKQENASFNWDFSGKVWLLSGIGEDLTYVITASDASLGTTSDWFKHAILNYTGSATEIVIPKTLNDVDIARIYQEAFKGKNMTSVTFAADSKIVQIHARAFINNSLTEISLPSSLTLLDQEAFLGNNITKVTIGANVKLGYNVFLGNDLFKNAYYAGGKSSGTYIYIDGAWIKQ